MEYQFQRRRVGPHLPGAAGPAHERRIPLPSTSDSRAVSDGGVGAPEDKRRRNADDATGSGGEAGECYEYAGHGGECKWEEGAGGERGDCLEADGEAEEVSGIEAAVGVA